MVNRFRFVEIALFVDKEWSIEMDYFGWGFIMDPESDSLFGTIDSGIDGLKINRFHRV